LWKDCVRLLWLIQKVVLERLMEIKWEYSKCFTWRILINFSLWMCVKRTTSRKCWWITRVKFRFRSWFGKNHHQVLLSSHPSSFLICNLELVDLLEGSFFTALNFVFVKFNYPHSTINIQLFDLYFQGHKLLEYWVSLYLCCIII